MKAINLQSLMLRQNPVEHIQEKKSQNIAALCWIFRLAE